MPIKSSATRGPWVSSVVLGSNCTLALLKSSSLLELLKSSSLSSLSLLTISSLISSWAVWSTWRWAGCSLYSGVGCCNRDRSFDLSSGTLVCFTFSSYGSCCPSFITSSNFVSFCHFALSFRICSRSFSRYSCFSSTGFGSDFFGVGCCYCG